ncbi:hypothetical protein F0L74_24655 [Chitinophaga agrisoli]|uniref:YD repeat-containing protein n=1 Tax=Chitinophaga agrisoli TaxID=2607653 RepID=A0A5B2VLN1_9BACT|nr:hypothetical protein [Chitinophaga agrisoli]KAA2239396.1 hypothetical protein F0L74_24655 [Chitinophaga agrisoli]
MKKLFPGAAALVLLFTACSKDDKPATPDQPNTPQTTGKYILQQITPLDTLEAAYDADNNMEKIITWQVGKTVKSFDELIRENGKLTKVMSTYSGAATKLRQTLEYNSAGKLVKSNWYLSPDGHMSSYDSLVYNATGGLAEMYEYSPGLTSPELDVRHVYIWDNNGNIIKALGLGISGIAPDTVFTEYTYDNKINWGAKQPEFFLTNPKDPAFGLSANNILKMVQTTPATSPDRSSVTTRTYTYDEEGYPVTRKDLIQTIQAGNVLTSYDDSFIFLYIKR